jgi:2-polyprenyl-3-methyl-5-hydroxy-6-metoxy-1,4-benzoquinol methylase
MHRLIRKILRATANYDPHFYDMYQNRTQGSSREDYLAPIKSHLERQHGNRKLKILDAGCQAGRLLIPLVKEGHQVVGADPSKFSLRKARAHLKENGLTAQLYPVDILGLKRKMTPHSLDALICAEVLYLCKNYVTLLAILRDLVKPEGLLFISHRPKAYYVLRALEKKNRDQAVSILNKNEGPSPDGKYHNWQTPQELEALYQKSQLNQLACTPVQYVKTVIEEPFPNDSLFHETIQPYRINKSDYRVPTYFLVVAQKPAPL